jgi:cell division protein FtsW
VEILSKWLLVFAVPTAWWERSSTALFFIGLLLLVLVLVPGIGRTVNGATRWIPLGPLNLQSSELMKLFAVIYISGYLVRRRQEVTTRLSGFLKPMFLMVIASALIMSQPDFGTTAVMLATVMALLFLGGVQVTHFAALFAMLAGAAAMLVIVEPYRLQRVTSFMHPFADPFDTGFQLSQALIAFGRGEWLGVGIGNGQGRRRHHHEAECQQQQHTEEERPIHVGQLADAPPTQLPHPGALSGPSLAPDVLDPGRVAHSSSPTTAAANALPRWA